MPIEVWYIVALLTVICVAFLLFKHLYMNACYLAANIEAACSTMGNMIPPAGVILTALACCNEFAGTEMSQSTFWFACWGVAIWFILQRIITVFFFVKYYKVKPIDKADVPSLKETVRKGWKNYFFQ